MKPVCGQCFKMYHLRNIRKSVAVQLLRKSSSQVKPLVGVSVDNEGIATLQLERPPVNGLNPELLQAIHESVCEAEKNKCKGVVLTSVLPTVFSAGLDLNEFYKPDIARFKLFQKSVFDVVSKLFGTDLITTMAINGYTGAGACIMAITCDYRVMTTGQALIGLNDTAVGIPPAKWIYDLMARLMGPKNAEHAFVSSAMYPAERAFQVGLIDEVATGKTDAIEKCKAFIRTYDNISPAILATAKRTIRQEFLTQFENNRKTSSAVAEARVVTPEFQEMIGQYIQTIKQRKVTKALNKLIF